MRPISCFWSLLARPKGRICPPIPPKSVRAIHAIGGQNYGPPALAWVLTFVCADKGHVFLPWLEILVDGQISTSQLYYNSCCTRILVVLDFRERVDDDAF